MKVCVIRSVVAAVWFGMSFAALSTMSDSIIFTGIVSIIMTSPIAAVAVLRPRIRTTAVYLLDVTAVLCCGLMAFIYVDSQPVPDALVGVVFILYPMVALGIIGAGATVMLDRQSRARGRGMCEHCAYDLSGLSPEHKCPECGQTRSSGS